jgi:hypothetical protein
LEDVSPVDIGLGRFGDIKTSSRKLGDTSATMSNAQNRGGARKISFNVSEQYDIQDVVGEGAYGVVW